MTPRSRVPANIPEKSAAGGGQAPSRNFARDTAEVCEWLREAAACLVDATRRLDPPPHPDMQPTYESVLASRQQIEQSRHDLIENIQMQSLHTVGSILAHELHNLSLRLGLLSENLEQYYGDPDFLLSAQRVLNDTVGQMQALVDRFRERQETVIVKIPTNINHLLGAVVREVDFTLLPYIEVLEDYGAGERIWADSFFLASAFNVLIKNALEAMPEGGRLLLRTYEVDGPAEASGAGKSSYVVVEIEDTGLGMTPEFIERELFAPFRSGKGRGLGLGMYICQHIIRLHDGTIQVESEPGQGTRFRLIFPKPARGGSEEAGGLEPSAPLGTGAG